MTLKEQIAEARRKLEEQELASATEDLSVASVAEEFITKGIPNLIKGAVAAPIALAKFIHSPTAQAESMAESVEDYAYDRWMTPSNALPEIGMIAGGALGAVVGVPNVGAGVGAALGTQLRNVAQDKPWTKEDVSSVMLAPLGNLPFAAAGAAVRMAQGTAKQTTKAETIFKSARLTPEQIATAQDMVDEAQALSMAKREMANFAKPHQTLPDSLNDKWRSFMAERKPVSIVHEQAGKESSEQLLMRKVSDAKAKSVIAKGEYDPRARQYTSSDPTVYSEKRVLETAQPQEVYFPKRHPVVDYLGYDVDSDLATALRRKEDVDPGYVGYEEMSPTSVQALQDSLVEMPKGKLRFSRVGESVKDRKQTLPEEYAGKSPNVELSRREYGVREEGPTLFSLTGTDPVGDALTKASKKAERSALRQAIGKVLPDDHILKKRFTETDADREIRKQQRLDTARLRVANHVAEQEALLMADKQIASNSSLSELWDDMKRNAQLSALSPDHLQPASNPYIKEMMKAGFLASGFNPHVTLNKLGSHGYWLSQNAMDAQDLYTTAVYKLGSLGHQVMDKYNVKNKDLHTHGLVYVLEKHPDLHQAIRTKGTAGITEWETATGNKLNVLPKDYKRLTELSQFRDEFRDTVMNPSWAFGISRNADPEVLANYSANFISPTFVSKRAMSELSDDVQSLQKAYSSLSEVDKISPHGRMLLDQHDALNRKLDIISKASEGQDKSLAAADQSLYKRGMKPGEVFNSSYKDKHTDMIFGTGLRDNFDDYISGFVKKAVYDQFMRRANEVITDAPWDAGTKRWATTYVLDQVGTRRKVQLQHMTDKLKQIPVIGKHITDDTLGDTLSAISSFKAAVDLGLNPKFYPMNAAQILVTGRGLIGDDGLAHGLMKVVTDWPNAYKRAVENGVVQSGLEGMWKEMGTNGRGHKVVRFTKEALDKSNTGLAASEALNRVLINEGGLFIAAKEGLKGRDAVRRARDITRGANFGYGAAERATMTGTPIGSLLARYKSYGVNQLSLIKHLMVHNPKAAAETLAMLVALGGTNAIPMYGMVQDQLAKHVNYNMPNSTPFDEVTGFDMSNSFSILPDIPGSEGTIASIAGPVLGPFVKAGQAAIEGEGGALGSAIGQFLGPSVMRPIRAYDEMQRGGLTTSPGGKPLIRRSTADSLKSAAGLKSTPKGEVYKHSQNIRRAHEAGDNAGMLAAIAEARKAGVVSPGKMLSTAKRLKKTEEKKKGTIDALLGR